MPIRDGSDPNHPLPLFLSVHADELEQWGTSRILKASILVIAVSVSGIGIALSLGNPSGFHANSRGGASPRRNCCRPRTSQSGSDGKQ